MKLNIYDKKKIVKTYTADTYDLMFGTMEEVANAVKIDELKTGSEEEILKAVLKLVVGSMGTIKDLMKDIFDGITDEELKGAKVKEMARVLVEVVQYTIAELSQGFGSKN